MNDSKPLCVLITSGGSIERIDAVRSIVNASTGELGAKIAEVFLWNGHLVKYIRGPGAKLPTPTPELSVLDVLTSHDLRVNLIEVLLDNSFDVVIHAMAVSDFFVEAVYSISDEFLRKPKLITKEKNIKLSSESNFLALVLKQTQKAIDVIKKIQPETILIGFKLTVGAEKEELIRQANELMKRSDCDFMLANDMNDITDDRHVGYLLSKNGEIVQAKNKDDIAQMIFSAVANE